MHTQQPAVFTDPASNITPTGIGHPFVGLPMELVERVGTNGTSGAWRYFNDFHDWIGPVAEGALNGWLLSGATGAATVVMSAARHGEIVLTADATAGATPTLGYGGAAGITANFLNVVGKRMWCFVRLKLATVASTELFLGLGTSDTAPCVTSTFPSDGIFFDKASAATKADFHARKDGTSTEKLLVTTTLVDDTYTTLGFQVNALGNIIPYQDGVSLDTGIITVGTANIPLAGDTMTFMLGILCNALTCTVDWMYIGADR